MPPSATPLPVPIDAQTTLADLRDTLFSLTDILPSDLHITLPSGATIPPDAVTPAPGAPLSALPLAAGDAIAAAAAPQPVSVDALTAALAAVRAPGGEGGGSEEGREFVRGVRGYYEAVMEYCEPRLQERARAVAPMEKMRREAEEAAAAAGDGGCVDAELARVLLAWFKGDFFTWVNALECWSCGGEGRVAGQAEPTMNERKYRANVVEVHECVRCGSTVRFGRFNDPGKLLETRKGRCGEWAQAFTLLAVTAGLEARICHDSTDHVWTE